MAEFDNFEGSAEDPAAEFLAREQNQMAGLEDDNFGGESAAPAAQADIGGAEPTGYEAVAQADRIREEPEKIKKWREEQKIRLEKKDKESEEKKGEWREIAKKELEDWYKHREEQLEKTFKLNREAEAAFVQERDDTIPGHEWERICRLCEFNPKAARNQKDVSRMRSILLQLKQAPLVR